MDRAIYIYTDNYNNTTVMCKLKIQNKQENEQMEISNKILSDITVYMKYAKYLPEENRRETWNELVTRNKNMHIKKYPTLKEDIENVYKLVST